ncbi:MAG: tRNA-dihydrouridine synthase family protein [Clostridiales bacterium]|nr:tRNA-dihydrouridine synthase family protein [Clostridiales bacterium]
MKKIFDKFIIALAPMAGVTDFAFRKICADFGADMVVTEMISLKGLENRSFRTEKMLREESDAIRVCQIFCHNEDTIIKGMQTNLFDDFDYIDINCGCPAPKIVKNGEGSAMMRDIENARKIISTLVTNSKKPVSVKFRLGIDGVENYLEFAKMCEDCGVAFITLHARTREQGYAGEVDKSAYKKLIDSVNIPVFWSGDLKTKQDIEYCQSIGCAGVMIGRASMGNPEIFSCLKGQNPPYSKKEAIQKHLELLKSYFRSEKTLVAYFKKHLMWYVKSTNCATQTKLKILEFTTLDQIECLINSLD